MMDGTMFQTTALSDVIEAALRSSLPFSSLRTNVYLWMRDHGYTVLGTDRVGGEGHYSILVTYWDEKSIKVTEAFDEWPSYTLAQPICTW